MKRADLLIRREHDGDIESITSLLHAAFPTDAEAKLVEKLRRNGRLALSLVAVDTSHPERLLNGHVAFSPVTLADGYSGLGLAPLAVSPRHQRRGIGTSLVRAALTELSGQKVPFVVVLGEPEYYSRFGFRPAAQWGMEDQFGGGDAFQALELEEHALPPNAGVLRYAPEFDIFRTP